MARGGDATVAAEGNRADGGSGTGARERRRGTDAASVADNADAGAALRAFIERIEALEEEKKAIADDVKDVFAELKGQGFDVRCVRRIIALRKQDPSEREEMETIVELYMNALGAEG